MKRLKRLQKLWQVLHFLIYSHLGMWLVAKMYFIYLYGWHFYSTTPIELIVFRMIHFVAEAAYIVLLIIVYKVLDYLLREQHT